MQCAHHTPPAEPVRLHVSALVLHTCSCWFDFSHAYAGSDLQQMRTHRLVYNAAHTCVNRSHMHTHMHTPTPPCLLCKIDECIPAHLPPYRADVAACFWSFLGSNQCARTRRLTRWRTLRSSSAPYPPARPASILE